MTAAMTTATRHHYVLVYELHGVTAPTGTTKSIELEPPAPGVQASIVAPDAMPPETQRAIAVNRVALGRMFAPRDDAQSFESLVDHSIEEALIKRMGLGHALLVVQARGTDPEVSISDCVERPGHTVSIDAEPGKAVRKHYAATITSLHAALALAAPRLHGIRKSSDVVLFWRDGSDVPHLCFTVSGGRLSISTSFPRDVLATLNHNVRIFEQQRGLRDLLARSLAQDDDALLAFLSSWSALELFIVNHFKHYEERFLASLRSADTRAVPERMIKRIREVMTDKYRLSDKFSLLASTLSADPMADEAAFDSAKKVRDDLLHGRDVGLDDLPTPAVDRLLRKYLDLHLSQAVDESRQPAAGDAPKS